MSDCCTTQNINKIAQKLQCPQCNERCESVHYKTVLHHMKQPWLADINADNYYFCRNSLCDIVYISEHHHVFKKSMIRTLIGVKEKSDKSLICYCFDVNRAKAKSDPTAKEFVATQTKAGNCSCETSNPSGKCCLRDFPK